MIIIVQHGEIKHGDRPRIHMNEKPACMVLRPTAVRFGEFSIIMASVVQSHGPDLILTPLSAAALPLAVLIFVALRSSLTVASGYSPTCNAGRPSSGARENLFQYYGDEDYGKLKESRE